MIPNSIPPQFWSAASPLQRQFQILRFTLTLGWLLAWDHLRGRHSARHHQRRAQWLIEQLLTLGPTFIKIGQSLSTRPDLIPPQYTEALSQLQDQVPPFDSQEAIAVIETELNQPLEQLFREFHPVPLASASLGQVYRAQLPTGEKVVIKVQRPDLESLLNLDFEVLHQCLRLGKRWLPGFKAFTKKYEIEAIYQEFFTLLFSEIDYIHEGKNADRFRQNFQDYPRVKVPFVYWDYTTRKVLTLEYLPGIKVDDRPRLLAAGINLDLVIQTGICSYLKQLLLDGFFQSDPHPGNMAVNELGELIFYDFGTMAEVKILAKDQMVKTFLAILQKDGEKILEMLIYMGLIEPVRDMSAVKRIVNFLLENFREKPVDVRAFDQISEEVYQMFQQQPFRLPPQMTFILKSIGTLDGIARALDPQYNLIAASQPFIQSIAESTPRASWLLTLTQQIQQLFMEQWQKNRRSDRFWQELEGKIERGELQFRVRSLEGDRLLKRIQLAIKSLIYACLTGFTLLSSVLLISTPYASWVMFGFGLTGLWSLFLFQCLLKLAIQERIDRRLEK
ncbi:MAG: AarF/ABC1/UbiB kinase family protein [Merismopediaceae bacterium]|nr:AarF/ABC1/UbiB kinase family protein [Merismopediaceae bacterium]